VLFFYLCKHNCCKFFKYIFHFCTVSAFQSENLMRTLFHESYIYYHYTHARTHASEYLLFKWVNLIYSFIDTTTGNTCFFIRSESHVKGMKYSLEKTWFFFFKLNIVEIISECYKKKINNFCFLQFLCKVHSIWI